MKTVLVLILSLAAVLGKPRTTSQRIVGGVTTTIDKYPYGVSMLVWWPWGAYYQECGGSILTSRTILSAAHCYHNSEPSEWRSRVGSTYANSGGVVHATERLIVHPGFDRSTFENDIAIIRTVTTITFNNNVQAANIAGSTYHVADNEPVWAIGWGRTAQLGSFSEQLREVQVFSINREICRQRYASIRSVSENMLCSGVLDVGGRDQCQGDSGGPLLHYNVIVGVCSWGEGCASAFYPGVNAYIPRYTDWIVANA